MLQSLALKFAKPIIRHGLQAAGGALAAYGFIDASQVEAFVGIGLNVGAGIWMLIDMRRGK